MASATVTIEIDTEKIAEIVEKIMLENPDLVEVVRCKDCIHAREDYPGEFYCEMTYYAYWHEADAYCSNGERGTDQ